MKSHTRNKIDRRLEAVLVILSLSFTSVIVLVPVFFPTFAAAAPAKSLPAKKTKRTFIDFSKDSRESSVVFKSLSPVDRALIKADSDVTEVRSRNIVAAPPGDLAEPLSAFSERPATKKTTATKLAPVAATKTAITAKTVSKTSVSSVAIKASPTPPPPAEKPAVAAPEEPTVTSTEPKTEPKTEPRTEPANLAAESPVATTTTAPVVTQSPVETTTHTPQIEQKTESATQFLRTGYLDAGYKKFDDRMASGATSVGYAFARDFETSFGTYEARVGFDIFHATDQSVSLANVRMLSLRVDATHWLTSTRVKPGLSLGAGLTETSIRSYRSKIGSEPSDITVRTHAEGLSVAVIPAAVLRVELSRDFKVDVQAEYLGLFGSEASEAARGTAVTVSFGWRP